MERSVRRKRAHEQERAEVDAIELGTQGGPGASARGRWAAKRARWVRKRGAEPEHGVRKRGRLVVFEERVVVPLVHGVERSTPEVERRMLREERRRQDYRARFQAKFKLAGGSARRMLRLLLLQEKRRARERDRGRVRLALTDRLSMSI